VRRNSLSAPDSLFAWLWALRTSSSRRRDSIEARLTIVCAALAVSRWIETQTGWSIRKFVKTARRYRTIQIQAGRQTITAADPLSGDLRQASKPLPAPDPRRTSLSQIRSAGICFAGYSVSYGRQRLRKGKDLGGGALRVTSSRDLHRHLSHPPAQSLPVPLRGGARC
jgi:hypothetical protein